MSILTADPPRTSHAATPPAAAQVQPTFAGVVRGEWIKLLSLRSTWWALASTAAVITLVALAAAASLNAMADDPALAPGIEQMHGAEVISSGFHFGMLTIAVLGALLITGEYATGLIRSTAVRPAFIGGPDDDHRPTAQPPARPAREARRILPGAR